MKTVITNARTENEAKTIVRLLNADMGPLTFEADGHAVVVNYHRNKLPVPLWERLTIQTNGIIQGLREKTTLVIALTESGREYPVRHVLIPPQGMDIVEAENKVREVKQSASSTYAQNEEENDGDSLADVVSKLLEKDGWETVGFDSVDFDE